MWDKPWAAFSHKRGDLLSSLLSWQFIDLFSSLQGPSSVDRAVVPQQIIHFTHSLPHQWRNEANTAPAQHQQEDFLETSLKQKECSQGEPFSVFNVASSKNRFFVSEVFSTHEDIQHTAVQTLLKLVRRDSLCQHVSCVTVCAFFLSSDFFFKASEAKEDSIPRGMN